MTGTPGLGESVPDTTVPRGERLAGWLSPVLAVPLLLGAGLGAIGGLLWWAWWGPAPDGKIYDTQVGPRWYPEPFDPGVTRDFSGTATYVVVGFALAVLLGVLAALVCRRTAVAGLLVVVAGAGLGAAAMALLGTSFSPPDPAGLVATREIGDALPGHLHVAGWTPYLAWPVGALVGYFMVMVSLLTPEKGRSPEPAPLTPAAPPDPV